MRTLSPERPFRHNSAAWIAWARLLAVPFALLEVAIEKGNYPPGYERWAWTTAGVFAAGAVGLFFVRRPLVGLVLDALVVSAFVCIYSFEPSSPVRELYFLVVIEGGLLLGARAAFLLPPASVPALWFFERQASDELGVPFDVGHVVGPVGLQLLVGLVVGQLAGRERGGPAGPPRRG
jgi:hypothetical protein